MKLKSKLFFFIIYVAGTAVCAQSYNSLRRIDSLTYVYYENTIDENRIVLSDNEIFTITADRFDMLVEQMGTAIPFTLHESVRSQMYFMKDPKSSYLWKAANKKNLYFQIFEEVLDRKGLPDEIKYLSIVESLLDPNAVSWCGATGLWQFMPATGRMMDLRIDASMDERKDIYKSTEKACDYLAAQYNTFGDWLLALAAYNAGPGNVSRAIYRAGGVRNFWAVRRFLPKETQNYIPKFLATAFLMTYAPPTEEEGTTFSPDQMLVKVDMCCPIQLKYVSAVLGLSNEDLCLYNSAYKSACITQFSETKELLLPYAHATRLVNLKDSVYYISENSFNPEDYLKKKTRIIYHKVKKGETIYNVAKKHNVTASEIKKWNRLRSTKLKSGQKLRIYEYFNEKLPLPDPGTKGYFYYVVDGYNETINNICGQFTEIDMDLTCLNNGIESTDKTLEKGSLIRIFTKMQNAE